MEKKFETASEILEDIRLHIDFDGMNRSRLRGIRDEFANKVKAFSRCYSALGPFLDKMCKSFNSRIANARTKELLETCDQNEIMQVYRTQAQIPVLILQLKRDEEKEKHRKPAEIYPFTS